MSRPSLPVFAFALFASALCATAFANDPDPSSDTQTTRASCELVRLNKAGGDAKMEAAIDAHFAAGRTEISIKKQGKQALLICGW